MNKLATFALATSMAVSSIAQQTAPSMVLTLKNGTVLEYELSDVEHITFRTGNDDQTLPANPVNIDVTRINTTSIMAKFSADDDEFTYVFGLTTKAEFDNIGNDDDFLAHDLNSLKQQAADYGMSF